MNDEDYGLTRERVRVSFELREPSIAGRLGGRAARRKREGVLPLL
jgi:hypothetical protein